MSIYQVTSVTQIHEILLEFDDAFLQPISTRFDLLTYAEKIDENGLMFVAQENKNKLGFIVFYANDLKEHRAYIAYLGVKLSVRKRNVGGLLIDKCVVQCKELNMKTSI